MKDKPPCMGCSDRQIGCHASCEKYKAWKQYSDEYNETERQQKQSEYMLRAVKQEIARRRKKGR